MRNDAALQTKAVEAGPSSLHDPNPSLLPLENKSRGNHERETERVIADVSPQHSLFFDSLGLGKKGVSGLYMSQYA